jgi:RNase H-like domain found in reverse transcriptase
VIETKASDYALAAILSQVEPNGEIHLVTYLSWTFSDTKLNYDTHDKELMKHSRLGVTTLKGPKF